MRKLFLIAIKDVLLVFRDRTALLFMLLAPFALTLGLGLATGSFTSKSSSGIVDLQFRVVNDDNAAIGNAFVEMVQSDELADLLEPRISTDLAESKQKVDENVSNAVVYIPAGFTDSILSGSDPSGSGETVQIELYGNPSSPTGVGIVKNIIEQFLTQVETGRIGGEVVVTQLLSSGAIDPSRAMAIGQSMGETLGSSTTTASAIKINHITANGSEVKFNILALLAPGMALMFLMYTVTNGGRSLLAEQTTGTLPRLLVSPISSLQVLGGKVFGIFLTGLAQMMILVLGTTLLFSLDWGDPIAVVVLVIAAVLGATGWGILLAALFKTPGQIAAIGSAIMLTFGVLGGSFTNIAIMPEWVQLFSRLSPNRWGLDGFTTLAMGGTLANILIPITTLLIMAAILFLISVILFSHRGIGKQ